MTAAEFRRIALTLDGAEEGSHQGAVDFRVGGRVFATMASVKQGFGNLMLTPEVQAQFVEEAPDLFLPVSGGWGRMGFTHIRLAKANRDVVAGALRTAWKLRVAKNDATRLRGLKPKQDDLEANLDRHNRITAAFAALAVAVAAVTVVTAVGRASISDDLKIALDLVLTVHPRPYTYVDPERLAAALERESGRLDPLEDGSDVELAQSLDRVLALVGDSHFAVALPSFQPGARTEPLLLPLLPKRAGNRVFVDASEPPVPAGTELLAIEGTDIVSLYEELATLALVDGDRPAARLARVERDFTLHFHLAMGTRAEYRARVRLPDASEQELTLPAAPREVIRALTGRRLSAPVWGEASTEQQPRRV